MAARLLLPPALDGTLYFLFESFALLGLSNSYDEDLYSRLNEEGKILADQHIGYDAPSIPVVITHGRGDDVIPFSTAEQLTKEWSERGGEVTFIPNDAGSHVAGTIPHIKESLKAIESALQ